MRALLDHLHSLHLCENGLTPKKQEADHISQKLSQRFYLYMVRESGKSVLAAYDDTHTQLIHLDTRQSVFYIKGGGGGRNLG